MRIRAGECGVCHEGWGGELLADCGLVWMEQRGRNRFCRPKLDKLGEVAEWVAQYRRHWESRLDNMEVYLAKLKKERYGKQKK